MLLWLATWYSTAFVALIAGLIAAVSNGRQRSPGKATLAWLLIAYAFATPVVLFGSTMSSRPATSASIATYVMMWLNALFLPQFIVTTVGRLNRPDKP